MLFTCVIASDARKKFRGFIKLYYLGTDHWFISIAGLQLCVSKNRKSKIIAVMMTCLSILSRFLNLF